MTFAELEQLRKKTAGRTLKILLATNIVFVGLALLSTLAVLGADAKVAGSSEADPSRLLGALWGFTASCCFILSAFYVGALFLAPRRLLGREYRAAYKAYFVERALQGVFTDLRYDHERGLQSAAVHDAHMISLGNIYESDDLVEGRYKDVAFAQADVHIGRSDDDGTTKYFKGRWMVFEFPKKFNFHLKVRERGFRTFVRVGPGEPKWRRIEVESPEFNRMFKIYAEDDFEAFYLLDPAMLDSIVKLGARHRGKIMLGFSENRLHVALYDNKNAFEPPFPLRPLDEAREQARVSEEIRVVTDFVDELRLNNKLFQ